MKQKNKQTVKITIKAPTEKQILAKYRRAERQSQKMSIAIDKLDQQIELLREKKVAIEKVHLEAVELMEHFMSQLPPPTQLQLSLGDIKKAE